MIARLIGLLCLCGGVLWSPAAFAEEVSSRAAAPDDLAVLAQKANNPLSDVWLLLTQNDTTLYKGDAVRGTKTVNSFKFQPVLPVPIFGGDYNLITRPIIPLQSLPFDSNLDRLIGVNPSEIEVDPRLAAVAGSPSGRTTGLGDTVVFSLVGPNRLDGWVWGVGPTFIFPTASDDILGQRKWQAGPAALAIRLGKEYGGLGIDNWNIGVLPQVWWDYAGSGRREHTAQADIQYFLNWKMNATQLVGMTPNIRVNFRADGGFEDKVSLPIGLGTIGMLKVGKLPVRWGVEVQYYLTQPDDLTPEWNFKVFLAPIIANPFKSESPT